MKSLSRPSQYLGAALLAIAAVAAAPPGTFAQTGVGHLFHQLNPLISHSTPGYLGVLVTDVDNDSAQKLKLKDNRGALVTLIDHDAPAGAVLRVNDVVLSVNGEAVEGAEHFGRILKEIPVGHKITLVINRDGGQQSLTIQLVDRKAMEQDVWNKMNSSSFPPPPQGMNILTGNGDVSGWHMPLFTSSLNVGALVEPLAPQMADYLDVKSGVIVKQVARKSEAELAGLQPKDVILKVGSETIKTSADWDRALRSNEGRPVQITILRDRRQQVLTLQVDSKHHHSRAVWTDMLPQGGCPQMALLDPQADALSGFQISQEQLDQLQRQAEQFAHQFQDFPEYRIDPREMEELQQQMDEFRRSFKPEDFRVDPKQMEELNRELEQFRQSFKPDQFRDEFRIDPKDLEELNRQMEQFRKQFPQGFHFDRRQLEDLQRQLREFQDLHFGQSV